MFAILKGRKFADIGQSFQLSTFFESLRRFLFDEYDSFTLCPQNRGEIQRILQEYLDLSGVYLMIKADWTKSVGEGLCSDRIQWAEFFSESGSTYILFQFQNQGEMEIGQFGKNQNQNGSVMKVYNDMLVIRGFTKAGKPIEILVQPK